MKRLKRQRFDSLTKKPRLTYADHSAMSTKERFLAELEAQAQWLSRGHATESYKFEDWADEVRSGRVTPAAVLVEIRARYSQTGNDDLIGKYAAILGEPLGCPPTRNFEQGTAAEADAFYEQVARDDGPDAVREEGEGEDGLGSIT